MKLTVNEWLRWNGLWPGWLRAAMRIAICVMTIWTADLAAQSQSVNTTTVQGTVYLANGQPAGGTLEVSWPTFNTATGQLIAAGKTTVTVGADGFVSVDLTPNVGATPAGEYYTATFYKSDGTVSTNYWVVPAAAQASLAQVQAQVMPAAQAVQAVSKAYVDQAVSQAVSSQIATSGGNLTGPLYLSGDPTQPLQAADKHYVDSSFSAALPMAGGAATGPLTATKLGAAYQVDQFPGADFGAKLQACLNAVNSTYGGTCDARNFTGTLSMGSNLTISTANTTVELPCATIATANQVIVTAGTRNVSLRGCALRGGSAANGNLGGTVFQYSGTGPMVQVGDPAYLADTPGFHLDNVDINTTGATSATAQGMAAYRTQEMDVESVYFLGNANQTAMTLDGTGNYTGGTFFDEAFNGFGTAVNAIGHQIANAAATDWLNASTFVRLHIDCPTSGGNPIAGTVGINLQQGDGNTFTGGDVEGCSTALHLGPNAQNNTIMGLRNENSTNQVVADAGSAYNNWITGGTMFTGKLTDNGTRNSFLDTFHRSFNGMNGDWYGSQQDATVTNHYRLGTGMGNERGLQSRYQTDYGYRWTTGLTDATAGEQFYQVRDELNNVDRVSVGQYLSAAANSVTNIIVNNGGCYSSNAAPALSFSGGGGTGAAATANMLVSSCSGGWTIGSVTMTNNGSGYTSQPAITWSGGNQLAVPNAIAEISTAGSTSNQTVLNAAGTGAVVLNGSNNSGTGGVVFGSGGPSETTVATINNGGNAQFNGTLQVGGASTFTGSTTVKNQADAEIDSILQAGLTAPQKESLIYRDFGGDSQWYMVKDQNNNWALNSAAGNLDSFKAYQSTNSGDTYINAAKSSGVVRVNYETGAGTAFNIYGGSSSNLYASFGAANAIKFPGLAASSGDNCLQIDNSGYISNTGAPCGSGSGGTVGSGSTGQIAYYTDNGSTLAGMNTIPVSAGGTGASTAAGALAALLPGVGSDGNSGIQMQGVVASGTGVQGPNLPISLLAHGGVCNGTFDNASILNSLTLANKGKSVRFDFPDGQACGIGSTVHLYSGQSIVASSGGDVQMQSKMVALPSFSGTDMIQLAEAPNALGQSGYFTEGRISGVTLDQGANTGLYAIHAASGVAVTDSYFDFTCYAAFCLRLDTYAQGNTVHYLEAFGGENEQLLYLNGNDNRVDFLDKERGDSALSSTTDPYVYITGAENSVGDIILEGFCGASKTGFMISDATSLDVGTYHYECNAGVSPLSISGSKDIRFGVISSVLSGPWITLTTSPSVKVDAITDLNNGAPNDISGFVSLDAASHLEIGTFSTQSGGATQHLDSLPNVKLDRTEVSPTYAGTGVGLSNSWIAPGAQNYAVNGDFNAGMYGWGCNQGPATSKAEGPFFGESAIQLDYTGHAAGGFGDYCYQNPWITVTAGMVNHPFTISLWVKAVQGTAATVCPNVYGGAGLNPQFINCGSGSIGKWEHVQETLIPSSTGNVGIGFDVSGQGGTGGTIVDVTGFSMVEGDQGADFGGKFASLELSGHTQMYGTAPPTQGTWNTGDYVWNSAPSEQGTAGSKYIIRGWSCVNGGSPGTWVQDRGLTGN